MNYIIFRDQNRFHITDTAEWTNYNNKYKRRQEVLESARLCEMQESLVQKIQHSTTQLVQRLLKENWSAGKCIYT